MGKRIILAVLAVLISSGLSQATEIRDFRDIRQDHRYFTAPLDKEFREESRELQKKADAFHDAMFFSPWQQVKSRFSREEIKWEFDKYGQDLGYGRKGKKHSRSWMNKLTANAQLPAYPAAGYPAITLLNTDLRVLPTREAHLSDPRNCPLPFDNMQNSAVAANTPVYVSHVTKDRSWVLVETHYALGWVPARHIATVDADFTKRWESGPYATIVKDKTPLYGKGGRLLFKASLGAFFPKASEDGQTIKILVAVAGKKKAAAIREIALSRKTIAVKPLALNAANVTRVANELMNEPYGWGGLEEKRDCSSTLMDFFAPFGIWLPRNSGDQAKKAGTFIDLKGLSPEEKEKAILKQGLPYFTLLWLKGHIMLYIGSQEGRALVFHNFWSVKTSDGRGRTGKKIIGRSAITTLNPGEELRQGKSEGNILPNILGMTLLWPPLTEAARFPQEEPNNLILN